MCLCVCEGAVGRQWAHTDTCSNSQKNKQSLLAASIISCHNHISDTLWLLFSLISLDLRKIHVDKVQNNTETRPRPVRASYVWLWAPSELRLLQLTTSLLRGCNFFVQRGEMLTSNRLLCFKTPQPHCSSSMNCWTCPCCWEQQWDKWQDFSISTQKSSRWAKTKLKRGISNEKSHHSFLDNNKSLKKRGTLFYECSF